MCVCVRPCSLCVLSKIQETKFLLKRKGPTHFNFANPHINKNPLPISAQPPLLPSPVKQISPPIRRLTNQQLQERRSKGLCYNCDDKWVSGHTCQSHKLLLLHLIPEDSEYIAIDSDDMILPEELIPEPCLSSQCVSHLASPGTLWLIGNIGAMAIIVLVDNGSTHNFFYPHVVKKLGLSVTDSTSHQVKIAAGLQIASQGVCPCVNLKLPGISFTLHFLVLPLGTVDVVLGTTWMQLLGDITFNISAMSMPFELDGQSFLLKGVSDSDIAIVPAK